MKTPALTSLSALLLPIGLLTTRLALFGSESPQPSASPDPWVPLRCFVGQWEGDSQGEPGKGKTVRTYAYILKERFIQVTSKSVYPPQEKNPKGETHEDLGFFSYDKAAKKIMLRQFHIEGFVCHYSIESMAEDGRTVVFVSTPIENFIPGWRGRETYRFLNNDELIETFALAGPGKEFATYSETHFRRKK
jgi:hypothetical protein